MSQYKRKHAHAAQITPNLRQPPRQPRSQPALPLREVCPPSSPLGCQKHAEVSVPGCCARRTRGQGCPEKRKPTDPARTAPGGHGLSAARGEVDGAAGSGVNSLSLQGWDPPLRGFHCGPWGARPGQGRARDHPPARTRPHALSEWLRWLSRSRGRPPPAPSAPRSFQRGNSWERNNPALAS